MTTDLFAKANRNLKRAVARDDINAAVRWTDVMLKQLHIIRTLSDLDNARPVPKPRRAKPKPETQATPTRAMPVMLDPDGFSPGGEPNWYLNMRRLQRAGLPVSLAPEKKFRDGHHNPTNS